MQKIYLFHIKQKEMNFCSRKIFIIYVLNFLLFVLLFQNIISLEKEDEDFILPDEYDLREEYKDCKSLRDIRDQYRCGGCWAFAVAEVISDRICIKSKGKEQPIISANELITCCNFCFNETSLKKGCGGGYDLSAYLYWIYFGLPTEECKPFHISPFYNTSNLKCLPFCEDINFKPTRYYGSSINGIIKTENEQTDIDIIEKGEILPRKADLRAFVLMAEEPVVWKSGLTRFSRNPDSFIVNSSQGGGFKDTWVLSR